MGSWSEKTKIGLGLIDNLNYVVTYNSRKLKKHSLDIRATCKLILNEESKNYFEEDKVMMDCFYHNG